jgi:hypothetical protein
MRSFMRLAVLAGRRVAGRSVRRREHDLQQHVSGGYRPYVYGYAAGRHDLTTVIVGNPFDIDQAELDRRLVDMLNESPDFLQPTHFTTTPGSSARPQYRAVFLFNRQIVLPGLACRAPEQVPAADLGATTRLVAVFCQQGVSQHGDRRAPRRGRHRRSAFLQADRADGAPAVPAGRSDPR